MKCYWHLSSDDTTMNHYSYARLGILVADNPCIKFRKLELLRLTMMVKENFLIAHLKPVKFQSNQNLILIIVVQLPPSGVSKQKDSREGAYVYSQ